MLEKSEKKKELIISTLIKIAQISNEMLNAKLETILQIVISDYVELFGTLHPLLRELLSVLRAPEVEKISKLETTA